MNLVVLRYLIQILDWNKLVSIFNTIPTYNTIHMIFKTLKHSIQIQMRKTPKGDSDTKSCNFNKTIYLVSNLSVHTFVSNCVSVT